MKTIKKFDSFLNEASHTPQKFTKTSTGMTPVGKKQDVKENTKIKKDVWMAMLDKVNKLPNAKKADLFKKLHQLGLM